MSEVVISDDPNEVKRNFEKLKKNFPSRKTFPIEFRIK